MRDNPEHRLSHWVNKLLEQILLPPCWFTAQDHSGRAIGGSPDLQMAWRQKQKWYGVKPSQLDWRVIQCQPNLYAEIELKHGTNQPDANQQVTMRLLQERGIPTGCCWTIDEIYELLRKSGFRLHPDADAIVARITQQHAAAELAASVKVPRRPRTTRKREPRPTPAQVRRAAATRDGFRF